MKKSPVTLCLSLITLLIVFGSITTTRAQKTDSSSDSSTTAECVEAFGNYEIDEFEGIELTVEQSSAVDQASERRDTQFEQILPPIEESTLESLSKLFVAELTANFTPEQQLEREGNPDIESLTSEQQASLERIQSQLFEDLEGLWEDLTPEQMGRLLGSEKTYEEAVLAILTPQQQEQFLQNRLQQKYPDLVALNLSTEQRQQITQLEEQFIQALIMEEETEQLLEQQYETQLMGVLNKAQKKQLIEIRTQQDRLAEQCW